MKKDVKGTILRETIRLIEEKGSSAADITIREISAAAGVGVGLINYHFQTKENLIAQCVQQIVSDTIGKFGGISRELSLPPVEKLRYLIKMTCAYLVEQKNIARISILSDLSAGSEEDNTSQTLRAYLPLVREACGSGADEAAVLLKTQTLLFALQACFLRREVLCRQLSLDFYQKEERERLIDRIIDLYFPMESK